MKPVGFLSRNSGGGVEQVDYGQYTDMGFLNRVGLKIFNILSYFCSCVTQAHHLKILPQLDGADLCELNPSFNFVILNNIVPAL